MNIYQKYTLFGTMIILMTAISHSAPNSEVKFTIKGMTCQGCVSKINSVLDDTKGIESFDVNLGKEEAFIIYDSTITNIKEIQTQLNTTHFSISEKPLDDNSGSSFFDKIKSLFK